MSDAHAGLTSGIFTVQSQERIVFGRPAEEVVVAEAERTGAARVFVTSTRSLDRLEQGPLRRIVAALGDRHAGTHARIGSHSPREDVVAAANHAREAQADLLVAVGGGSVVDATKAMQLCLWLGLETPEAMEPYCSGFERTRGAELVVPADPVRMIAVTTTLSASEFTRNAGITDTHSNSKQSFNHRMLVPRVVILDPAATLDTPDWLLLSTGIRAVDHAVETYCAERANPATEALSLHGLRLLVRALRGIKASPRDLAPRLEAQFGMWQAIAPIAAGVFTGASHGIGYALGAAYGVPHGQTSCVMLPAVLRWNAAVNGERQRALAEAMGAPDRPAADLVAELVADLDLPGSLRAVGIKRTDLDALAERALRYHPVQVNPRKIETADDVREILELAW